MDYVRSLEPSLPTASIVPFSWLKTCMAIPIFAAYSLNAIAMQILTALPPFKRTAED
jgi:hypothetical protein